MDIFEVFRAAENPAKAAQMSAYMRHQFSFLGIQKPERGKLSRDFFKGMDQTALDWDFVFKCWQQSEREFQYLAVDYLSRLKGLLTADDISKLRDLAVSKSWWDTVDGLNVIIGDLALRFTGVKEIMLRWSTGGNIWLRRIAIDHQLMYKKQTDRALLERIIINNLGGTEFFINKAIGWSLRQYSKTDPDWVRSFIERHRGEMAALSIREAGKYI
ncbi:MAG: DNA alkylation repair protein [Firmicutes bacterium]|nr:DNA alkylation repair protein [Bacillota bacterium]